MIWVFLSAIASGSWRWWVLYGAAATFALFSFMTVMFVIIGQGLYLFYCGRRRVFWTKWVACLLVACAIFGTWIAVHEVCKPGESSQPPSAVSHINGSTVQRRSATDLLGTIPYTFFAFSVGFSLGPSVRELHRSRSFSALLRHAPTLAVVAILFASLFALGLAQLRREKDNAVFLLTWLSVPIIGVFLVGTITSFHVYNTRYVAMVLPAFLLILARGIAGLRRPVVQASVFAAVLCVNVVSLDNYYHDGRYSREDARGAAQYLESTARQGDAILSVGSATALRHYYRYDDNRGAAPIVRLNLRNSDSGTLEDIRGLGKKYNRLWLVQIRPWETDPQAETKKALDKLFGPAVNKKFPGVEIYLYDLARVRSFKTRTSNP
jgi:4-amino-4-deoxy-L-arabinose transferase-like glycosyltransferase